MSDELVELKDCIARCIADLVEQQAKLCEKVAQQSTELKALKQAVDANGLESMGMRARVTAGLIPGMA
jgi:hypothetical protein